MNVSDLNAIADRADRDRSEIRTRIPRVAIVGTGFVGSTTASALLMSETPAEWQYNQLATVQGGWLSALLESALGYAVQSVLPAGRGFTTLDLHVRFMRAVTEAVSRLRTEAHVTHAGNRTVTAEGRIVGPDGKVYATGTTSRSEERRVGKECRSRWSP